MRKTAIGLLVPLLVALALCFGLVGCGGSAATTDAAEGFAGTWEISGMTSGSEQTTADELELLKSLGASVYLTLDEGGKATLELFGNKVEGSWESKDANGAVIKFNEDSASGIAAEGEQDARLASGMLTLEHAGSTMVFKKIDPANKVTGDLGSLLDGVDLSNIGSAIEGVESGISASATDATASLSDVRPLDITIADDDFALIRVTSMGDYYGDPGYVLSVTNKGGSAITVDDNNEFEVDGTVISPVFSVRLEPGETKDEVLWFDNSEIGDKGVDGLTNVTGVLVITNAAGDELTRYNFEA
jgi:hypothetical protein